MDYMQYPNLLLEALAYLGRKANGNTWEHMEQRILQRHMETTAEFEYTFSKLKDFTEQLDNVIFIDDKLQKNLFENLEGMPNNTIGSGSAAFILFYPFLETYDGDLNFIVNAIQSASPERIASGITGFLDLSEEYSVSGSMDYQAFFRLVLAQALPEKTKLALLNIYSNYPSLAAEAAKPLSEVLRLLEQKKNSFYHITEHFHAELSELGCEKFLHQLSHFEPAAGTSYLMRPFIFGMDTNLSSDMGADRVCLYCGISRKALTNMLNIHTTSNENVYEAFRLLGDKTRFDILCYLRNHRTYGQELSTNFNLSRNTIHHHMNKLINANLVTCSIEGNRVYYALNRENLEDLIQKQTDLFLSGSN